MVVAFGDDGCDFVARVVLRTEFGVASCDGNKLVDITLMNDRLSEDNKVFAFGMTRKELMMS